MTKARKDYRCDLCDDPISAGSDYEHYVATPWDRFGNDSFYTFHYHLACAKAARQLDLLSDEPWPNGRAEFVELLQECEIAFPWEVTES